MKNNIYFLIRSLLISLLLFLLLPSLSFAQGLAPIPDVGPGVCVSNCGSNTNPTIPSTPLSPEDTGTTSMPYFPPDIPSSDSPFSCLNDQDCSNNGICTNGACDCSSDWDGKDCSVLSPFAIPVVKTHLDNAINQNTKSLQALDEGEYVKVSVSINSTIEFLNTAKNSLKTDPVILEFCKEKPNIINKIERKIQSSINNQQKASLIVNHIIEITSNIARLNNNSRVNKEEDLLQKLLRVARNLINRRIPKPTTTFAVCGVRG